VVWSQDTTVGDGESASDAAGVFVSVPIRGQLSRSCESHTPLIGNVYRRARIRVFAL
jgi:hypothetical protein